VADGNAAYLYLFGSAFAPLGRNQGVSPLILPTAASSAVPSPGAIVLSLPMPERDFYRLGVGVNLSQVFSKIFTSERASGGEP